MKVHNHVGNYRANWIITCNHNIIVRELRLVQYSRNKILMSS